MRNETGELDLQAILKKAEQQTDFPDVPLDEFTPPTYVASEDEPQIQLHLNFIANRGKAPAVGVPRRKASPPPP